MNRIGVTQIPVDRLEDVSLSLEDFVLGVRAISTIKEVRDGRGNYLLDLGGDEKACYPHQLKFGERHDARGKESVDDVDTEEKGLGH